MRSRDTDQMIKVSKAMKVLKREGTSGKCQLTWSARGRKFGGRKAAFFRLSLTACCLRKQTVQLASIASARERGDKVKVLRGSPWPRPWSLSWAFGASKLNRFS